MAVASTSLASQMSGPKSATSISCPQFSGLRKSFSKLDNSVSFSTSQAFFQTVDSHLRLSADRKGCRAVVAMAGSGKFFVGGNWKCNGTKDSISKLVSDLNNAQLESDVDVVVAPPFLYIDQVKNSLTDRIEVSAQNCWTGKGGAFTGEISVEQVKDLGCKWVILGHSERRHVIGENDEFIGKKAAYALSQGVGVIACIGELLQEREAGKTFDVCFQQLKAFADAIPSWDNVVIAYEPVWAIGTVASPDFSCHNHVQQAVNCFDTIHKAWYEALDFSHKGLAGVCHQMHFVHLKVNVTAPRLPMLSLARSLDLNLEDKVLIEDGSIVMNQPQSNRDTNKDITQIDIGPSKSNRARPSQRIVWDPGPFTLC